MTKIKPYSNWNSLASIDGTETGVLRDKDVLHLLWPDGTETTEEIRVEPVRGQTYNDMGHTCQMPVTRAYVLREVNGLKVEVNIDGLKGEITDRIYKGRLGPYTGEK